MTKNVVFDSYSLIAHFKNEKGADFISDLLTEVALGEKSGYLCVVNLGKIYYMLHRKTGLKNAEKALYIIQQMPFAIVNADYDLTYRAAQLKAQFKISFADAYAAALTTKTKGTLITGDSEFRTLLKVKDFKVHFI